jgi:hypothetical protein
MIREETLGIYLPRQDRWSQVQSDRANGGEIPAMILSSPAKSGFEFSEETEPRLVTVRDG